jgi:hypothetical protein
MNEFKKGLSMQFLAIVLITSVYACLAMESPHISMVPNAEELIFLSDTRYLVRTGFKIQLRLATSHVPIREYLCSSPIDRRVLMSSPDKKDLIVGNDYDTITTYDLETANLLEKEVGSPNLSFSRVAVNDTASMALIGVHKPPLYLNGSIGWIHG